MSVRINKLLSDSGLGSRREVEKYVLEGRVQLNGERAELTDFVVENDVVTLDGEELPVNEILREVLSMEKYLSSMEDDDSDSSSGSGGKRFGAPGASGRNKTLRNDHKVRTMRGNKEDWNDFSAHSSAGKKHTKPNKGHGKENRDSGFRKSGKFSGEGNRNYKNKTR
ncbi:MAG: S4 domain-containing protein [Porphyromonas sp.]|nr:S4 domain-containing protein [Porphyromonas sp.]